MGLVGTGALFNGEGATAAVDIPTHLSGDTLVLGVLLTQASGATQLNVPGGDLTWTRIQDAQVGGASAVRLEVFEAVGDGSTSSVTVQVSSGTDPRYIATVAAFDQLNGTVETVAMTSQGTGTDIDSPAITPTAKATIFRAYVFDSTSSDEANHDTDPSFLGTSIDYGEGATPGNGLAGAFSYQLGATGAQAASTWLSNGDSDAGLACSIAFLESAGAPAVPDSPLATALIGSTF